MIDSISTLDLDALLAIVRQRTPGEWTQALDLPSPAGNPDKRFIWAGSQYIGGMQTGWLSDVQQYANTAAVVAAVNAIEPLIERCKRAEAACKAAIQSMSAHGPCRNNNCRDCAATWIKLQACVKGGTDG